MRILITTPHQLWPNSSGGARRTVSIGAALAQLGHRVTLLAPALPPAEATLPAGITNRSYRSLGTVGHFANPFFTRQLSAALAEGQDLMLATYPYQARALTRACRRFKTPLVYDAHNCEADRSSQMRGELVTTLVRRRETRLLKSSRAVLCVSPDDQMLFKQLYGRDSILLPNGVDTRIFNPGKPDHDLAVSLGLQDRRIALFFGSFDYLPNQLALKRLLALDWPIKMSGYPDTHLLVVGRLSTEFTPARPGVKAAGEVTDITRYIRLANLVLAPLEEGGGTRLKIIEALACSQTVLATHFGAQGLGSGPISGLHCCDWHDFDTLLHDTLGQAPRPAGNPGGREWARQLDWLSLVREIPWDALATGIYRP